MNVSNIRISPKHFRVGMHQILITFTAEGVVAGDGSYEVTLSDGPKLHFLNKGEPTKILGPIDTFFKAEKHDIELPAIIKIEPPSGTELPFSIKIVATNVDEYVGQDISDGLTHN